MPKLFLKGILPLLAILVFQFISTQASAACNNTSSGNWSGAIWLTGAGNCSTSPPAATDNVTIFFATVTLDQNVAVNQITLALGKPIADMDLLIAATAKRYALVLATNDSNLDNLDFLTKTTIDRENWVVLQR